MCVCVCVYVCVCMCVCVSVCVRTHAFFLSGDGEHWKAWLEERVLGGSGGHHPGQRAGVAEGGGAPTAAPEKDTDLHSTYGCTTHYNYHVSLEELTAVTLLCIRLISDHEIFRWYHKLGKHLNKPIHNFEVMVQPSKTTKYTKNNNLYVQVN